MAIKRRKALGSFRLLYWCVMRPPQDISKIFKKILTRQACMLDIAANQLTFERNAGSVLSRDGLVELRRKAHLP